MRSEEGMSQVQLRSFICGVRGTEWRRVVNHVSRGKAKAEYWHQVRDACPDLPFTAITCRVDGHPSTSQDFMRTASYRGVDFARCGMLVRLPDGRNGRIVGNNYSANFNVLVNGVVLNCHPHTLAYFDEDGTLIRNMDGERRDA